MRILRASFLARRMGSAWVLIGCLVASVLVTSALISALVNFYSGVLPDSTHRELENSGAMSLVVTSATVSTQQAPETTAVKHWMRNVFGTVPYQFYGGVFSDDLDLPGPAVAGNVPVIQAAAISNVTRFAVLNSGSWPAGPRRGQPIPVAMQVQAASQLHLGLGSVLTLRDRYTGATVKLQLTGLFRQRQPISLFWNVDPIGTSGLSVGAGFASYGPVLVSPAAFSSAGLAEGSRTFVALPNPAAIPPSDLTSLAHRISSAAYSALNGNVLGGADVSTSMPQALASAARGLVAARSLLIISGLLLLLLAAAALALAGRLLASHRDEECALLTARGADRWQLIMPSVAEATLACAVAAVVGAIVGGYLAALLLTGVARHSAGLVSAPLTSWLAVAAVFLFCLVIVVWPTLRPTGIATVRVRRGRQALVAGALTAGVDVGLIVLAVLSVRELRTYSAANGAAGAGIDPVIAIAPALALAGLAVIALRLLPLTAKGLDRLSARGRRLGTAMANWEISRRPVRQSGPVLLVILAVATGTLALAQYQSWRQSVTDQADFSVGADVQVDLPQAEPPSGLGHVSRLPGVITAMPVSQTGYSDGDGIVLAIDAKQAAQTVLLRSDLSPVPAARLWREIMPTTEAGVAIPGKPAVLAIRASVRPGAAGVGLGPLSAQVTVQDASGATYTLDAGSIVADGKSHELRALIAPANDAKYPLRFLGLSLNYNWAPTTSPPNASPPAIVSISGLAAATTVTSPATRFAAGTALSGFAAQVSAPDLQYLVQIKVSQGAVGPQELSWSPAGVAQQLTFRPGHGPYLSAALARYDGVTDLSGQITLTAPDPARVVPAIATSAFLADNNLRIGATVAQPIGTATVALHIVSAISDFPSVVGTGAVIVDQTAIQDAIASQNSAPLPVSGLWLRTAGGKVPLGLPSGSAISAAGSVALGLQRDPLSTAPVEAAVAISAAAALLAGFGFCVSVAATARTRRTQRALLAALGVPVTAQARLACLEVLMLGVPSSVIGLAAGTLLAYLLVPALTLSATAGTPVPAVLVSFPVGWIALLVVAVPGIPVIAAALSAVRQPDPAAELRAAEAA
jgi:hypothetical protein